MSSEGMEATEAEIQEAFGDDAEDEAVPEGKVAVGFS